MATIDAVFIFGDFFGEQNAQFNAAAPAADLPRLQVADIGDVSTDYGDYFVAGLVGGILAAERRPQAIAALATFVVAQAFNQLFLVVDSLPGTVPPALVLLAFEARERRARPARASNLVGRQLELVPVGVVEVDRVSDFHDPRNGGRGPGRPVSARALARGQPWAMSTLRAAGASGAHRLLERRDASSRWL